MNYRNQNRPPRTPLTKKDGVHDAPVDKRRKLGPVKTLPLGTVSRGRQVCSTITNSHVGSTVADRGSHEGSLCASVPFTMEDIEPLLNEKFNPRMDFKEKQRQTNDYTRRLKDCIKWLQQCNEIHVLESEKLQNNLESVEKKLLDAVSLEEEMKGKVAESNVIIEQLRTANVLLEEKISNEELDKLNAIEKHTIEKQARVVAETQQATLLEDVAKARKEILIVEQRANDMHKSAQEYNISLQHYNSKLQSELATANESLKRVEEEKMTIVENLGSLRIHYSSLQDQLATSKASHDEAVKQMEMTLREVKFLRDELHQVRDDRDRQVQLLLALNADFTKHKESAGKSVEELNSLTKILTTLKERCSSQEQRIHVLEDQLATANVKLKMTDCSASEARTEFENMKRLVVELEERLLQKDIKINEGEIQRKILHNTISELKGNIRVFCRVRPLLPDEIDRVQTPLVSYPTSTSAVGEGIELMISGKNHGFEFDKVFSQDASQQDVFIEISQLVQSALDGYKVCIFAYGQTGSGKTYTMMGRPDVQEQTGLIPRSLEQIFKTIQILSTDGWRFKMQASMLEIYNEDIHDLLSTNRPSGVHNIKHEIKHDASGNIYVSHLTNIDVSSMNQISSLLHLAAQRRSVGKTQMNEHSSRSHFVFKLEITGDNERTEEQRQGVLNIIDLAGSERVLRSGALGDRLTEATAINSSLSCLGNVINAIAEKKDHVPYRDSKLTRLLEPYLGGDSKLLMFVNISPDNASIKESLSSLRFAKRANNAEIGIPRRQA